MLEGVFDANIKQMAEFQRQQSLYNLIGYRLRDIMHTTYKVGLVGPAELPDFGPQSAGFPICITIVLPSLRSL